MRTSKYAGVSCFVFLAHQSYNLKVLSYFFSVYLNKKQSKMHIHIRNEIESFNKASLRESNGKLYRIVSLTDEGKQQNLPPIMTKAEAVQYSEYIEKTLYCGQTILTFHVRFRMHCKHGSTVPLVKEYIVSHGKESIAMVMEADHIIFNQLNLNERDLILKYDTLAPNGLNLDLPNPWVGAGKTRSQQTKDKIRTAHNNNFYQQLLTEHGSVQELIKEILTAKSMFLVTQKHGLSSNRIIQGRLNCFAEHSVEENLCVKNFYEQWAEVPLNEKMAGSRSEGKLFLNEMVDDLIKELVVRGKRRTAWSLGSIENSINSALKRWETDPELKTTIESFTKLPAGHRRSLYVKRISDDDERREATLVTEYILANGVKQAIRQFWLTGKDGEQCYNKRLARWRQDQATASLMQVFDQKFKEQQERQASDDNDQEA